MTSPRPDTRYLGTAPITTDLSQRLTNLTIAAPGGYELTSARTAINGSGAGRSIELACEINTVTTGVLVDHSNGAGYRVSITAGGVVVFANGGVTVTTITAPGVGAGAKDYVVAWSTEPNPATTGAADAQRSEFLVYDRAVGTLSWQALTHTVVTPSPAGTFTVAGVWTGAMTLIYALTIDAVRVSCRFHTRVEIREHFVLASSPAAPTGPVAVQLVTPPAAMLEPGELAGPGYQFAAASMQTTRDRHRLVSPVWQWSQLNFVALSDNMRNALGPRWVWDLGDGWQSPLNITARRRIPRHTSWLRVIVQWATWRTNPIGPTDTVELRLHTADGHPNSYTNESHKLISRTVDDLGPAGIGVLQVMDFVWVERGDDGYTWLWVSARTDGGSGMGNATYTVRGISVLPVVLSDGYDGQVPNQWGP